MANNSSHLSSVFTALIVLTLASCGPRSEKTEVSFTTTIDVLQVGGITLPSEFDDVPVRGFLTGDPFADTDPVTRYIGEFPRATLRGAGPEVGACNDGQRHLVALDPSPDRPLTMTAQVIGDTGAEDVSTDDNCRCDSRIDEIEINELTVFFDSELDSVQLGKVTLTGSTLCPNIPDGHLVSGDREFGGSVDIFGAVVLRVAPDRSTILADISLSMVESDHSGS